jgi:hypothetical protein
MLNEIRIRRRERVNSQRIVDWIQIITGVALVLGLALVGVELTQSRDVAEAQLSSEGINQHHQSLIALMGENPAPALAKACHDPQALSDNELVVLDSYYASLITAVNRYYLIEKKTGLSEGRWAESADSAFFLMFRSLPGRTWWEHEKDFFAPEIGSFVESLTNKTPPSNGCWISNWRARIQEAQTL